MVQVVGVVAYREAFLANGLSGADRVVYDVRLAQDQRSRAVDQPQGRGLVAPVADSEYWMDPVRLDCWHGCVDPDYPPADLTLRQHVTTALINPTWHR